MLDMSREEGEFSLDKTAGTPEQEKGNGCLYRRSSTNALLTDL